MAQVTTNIVNLPSYENATAVIEKIKESGYAFVTNVTPETFDANAEFIFREDGTNAEATLIQIPSLVQILDNNPDGVEFAADAVRSVFKRQVAASLGANRKGGSSISELVFPTTFAAWNEDSSSTGSGQRRMSKELWNEYKRSLATSLKAKGVQISLGDLEKCLSNAAFARAMFANINDAIWVKLLDFLIAKGVSDELDTDLIEHWKATREESAHEDQPQLDSLDLSDF